MTLVPKLGAIALLASGCSGDFPHPSYTAHTTAELVEVAFPPPPARVEAVPEKPAAGALWIDGEWVWRSRKWAWRTGYWVAATTSATYSPWQVTRSDAGTLFFAPGTWRDAAGQPAAPPPPLALAGAETQSVVDAEGESEPTAPNLAPDGGRLARRDAGR
jgi:hypothetical protein